MGEEEGIRLRPHANKVLQVQRQNDAVAMLLDGLQSREVVQYLASKYKLKPGRAARILVEAKEIIKLRLKLEVNSLITLHLLRYEELYALLKELGAEIAAMEALRHKEVLLGFHRTGFHMRVSAGQVQQVFQSNVQSEYDLTKLTNDDRVKFDQLIHKARPQKLIEQEKVEELAEWKEKRHEEKFRRDQGAILV